MAENRRTRTPSAGMEAALLASAADLLEREGPDALSVRRIAAAAHVAPMGVYNHFQSKSGIVEALFVQGFRRLREALASLADIADPLEALRESGRRYRALALAHPAAYQVMFLRAVPGFVPSVDALAQCAGSFDGLEATVRRALDAGVLAPGDPTELSQVFWAAVHGWVSLELVGISFVPDQEAGFTRLCDALLDGLRPPSGA